MGLLEALIQQSKKPESLTGRLMLGIMNAAHARMTRLGLQHLVLNHHQAITVLDVGCGGGQTLNTLSSMYTNAEVHGIDFSRDAVEMSQRKNRVEVSAGRVNVRQGDVINMPYESNYFDAITAVQTHYHWPDLECALKEIYRVLKPEGQFIIISELYKIQYHMEKFTTIPEMEELFKNLRFRQIEVIDQGKWIFLKGGK